MKTYQKVHKKIFHFTIALIFIIGLCCPSSVSLAQEQDNDVGHSGGFIIKSDKIEGTLNPIEILRGTVDISEGQIFGLSITKELVTDQGTIFINIKTDPEEPVPIDNLKAKAIGLPFFADLCEESQEEWICMAGVEMTLTEQAVNSIYLPNAKVEACYEGQCEGDKEEDIEAMSLMLDEDKSIEDIEQDLNSVTEILAVVEEQLENAKETNQTIIGEEQEDKVEQSLERFNSDDSNQDELVDIANDIHEHYSTFNEHVSHLALTTAVVDDILTHVTLLLEQDEEELARLEGALDEAKESISEQKQNKQTQEALAEQEEVAETIASLKETMANIGKTIDNHRGVLKPLAQSSTALMANLTRAYESIQSESEHVEKINHDQIEQIRQALDVAEPAKGLEKQLQDLLARMDETELPKETAKHEQVIEEASEQAASSILSVSLAKQIGELDARNEEEIEEESGTWKKQFEQLNKLKRKYDSLVKLVELPEKLALEHELDVLVKEKHEYRVKMLTNISKWKKLLDELNEKKEQIEEALEQHEANQQSLDQLANAIMQSKQHYTPAELSTFAQYLPIKAHLERERKLSETIKNGTNVMNSIEPAIESATNQIKNLEALSSELINKRFKVVNTLDDDSFKAFTDEFNSFKNHVNQFGRSIKQLNNHLAIAEDLLGNRVSEYKEIQQMYATIDTVADIMYRLEQLIEDLDALPYFGKVKGVISEMEAVRNQMDSMLQ